MVWIGRALLCLVMVSLCACESRTTHPGLKVRLSENAINFVGAQLVEKMSDNVHTIPLPDEKGHIDIPLLGKINYEIMNFQVSADVS